VVQISGNNPKNSKYVVERIWTNGYSNSVVDNINNVTLGDAFTALYSFSGIRAGAIYSGASTPMDIAGRVALSGGSATQALTAGYLSPPNCGCWDVTTPATVCKVSETTTQLTFSAGTGNDMIKYICIGRN
jgi:hypothetical protein